VVEREGGVGGSYEDGEWGARWRGRGRRKGVREGRGKKKGRRGREGEVVRAIVRALCASGE